MSKTFTQVFNESFDLSYSYHDDSVVLTFYKEDGDTDELHFEYDCLGDFVDLAKGVFLHDK